MDIKQISPIPRSRKLGFGEIKINTITAEEAASGRLNWTCIVVAISLVMQDKVAYGRLR
jgi:hypothetical protein